MEGPRGTDGGDPEQEIRLKDYRLDEVLFFLLESGMPSEFVYGYHDGWDFDRLLKAFWYYKQREIEKERSAVVAVALGASTLFSAKAYKSFERESRELLNDLVERRAADPEVRKKHEKEKLDKLMGGFNQLAGFVTKKQ